MGYGYQKYLKIIPMNKATLLVTVQPFQQNLKQSQHKMAMECVRYFRMARKLNGFAS